jgi:uncharacterized protein (TIGR03437 family)
MPSGSYDLLAQFSTVDQSPPSETSVIVSLRRPGPPSPAITSVVNNASYQAAVSPGQIVSIFGSNIGPDLGPTEYDDAGCYPRGLVDGEVRLFGLTTVTFGGIAAPLLYSSPSRVDAIIPSDLAGQPAADLVITRYGRSSAPFTVLLLDTSPGIYTLNRTGSGQGAILNLVLGGGVVSVPILNSTPNGENNPAPKGSAISFLATGFGPWNPPVSDGIISLGSGPLSVPPAPPTCGYLPLCRSPAASVGLTIGGKRAIILYTGPASYRPWSVLQVAAYVPDDVESGSQPIVQTVGQNDNAEQNVTVAIE